MRSFELKKELERKLIAMFSYLSAEAKIIIMAKMIDLAEELPENEKEVSNITALKKLGRLIH